MAIELMLLRHGQTAWIRDQHAVDNPPLTDRGHDQAALAGKRLATIDLDHFAVSPLQRAQQTAQHVAEAREKSGASPWQPQTLDWLEEFRVPMKNRPLAAYHAYFADTLQRPPHQWWDGFEDGERPTDFFARVGDGLRGWLNQTAGLTVERVDDMVDLWQREDELQPGEGPSMRVLMVAHGGTIGAIVTNLLGIAPLPWDWERFKTELCGITTLKTQAVAGGLIWTLVSANDTHHLAELPAGPKGRLD